jgi:hypothetical protein
MKVAILIVGHIRTWKECKNNFLESFIHLNPDVFVSTYDLQYNYHPAGRHWMGNTPDEYLLSDEIKNLFNDINLIDIEVEKIENVLNIYENDKQYLHFNFQEDQHTVLQYRKINKALELMKQNEIKNAFEYDAVIKIRSDIYHKKFQFDIPENSVTVSSKNVFPNDILIASKREVFIKLFEFINAEFYNQTYTDSHLRPPHNLLLCSCKHYNFDINTVDMMDYVVRKTGRNYYTDIN